MERALESVSGKTALDLYAGVGLFAVPLARRFETVTAVEAGSSAARDLEVNAERAGVQIRTELARVEDYLAKLDETPDFVLADPPRAGLGKTVVGHLARIKPPPADHRFLRSGDVGSRCGCAPRLQDRAADAGGSVPANVSPGNHRATRVSVNG